MQQTWRTKTQSSILAIAFFLVTAAGAAGQGMVDTCRQISLSRVSPGRTFPPGQLALPVPEALPEPSVGSAPDEEAQHAAVRTALRLAEEGRRQAHRLGFYDGLHAAFEDADLERMAYLWGLGRGRRSLEARRTGGQVGREAAVFRRSLEESRPGRRRPRSTVPEPALTRLEKRASDLEQVFREYPLTDVLLLVLLDIRYLSDPWSLYQEPNRGEVFDDGWQKASAALRKWLDENPQDRQRRGFQEVFLDHYPRELASVLGDGLHFAYSKGYIDGWRYGFVVQSASSCRRGFADGWNETMRSKAQAAFRRGLRGTREPRSPLSSPR